MYAIRSYYESGEYPTVARLAEGLNFDPSNLMKALKMTTLSPKIQEMILSGDIPNTMTLTKFYSDFPEDWEEQEHHFGMEETTKKLDVPGKLQGRRCHRNPRNNFV